MDVQSRFQSLLPAAADIPGEVRLDGLIVQDTYLGGGLSHTTPFSSPRWSYPVSAAMRLYHEEQFGPVIPVVPFDSLDTPIHYIINANYGHQASIFASHAQRSPTSSTPW
jgi:acyl-CoA reductase-like NAD-dependent aldehyde dehydrogenase